VENLLTDRWLIVVLVGAAMLVLALGVSAWLLSALDPVRSRLGEIAEKHGDRRSFGDSVAAWMHRAAKYVLPRGGSERDRVQNKLVHAGFRKPNALAQFYGIKIVLSMALGAAVLLGAGFFPKVSAAALYFYVAMAGAIGIILPGSVLSHLVERRHKLLRNGFPDALDMLVICVESGLGLTAAIQRVGDELQFSHPELSAELSLVNAEMRAGVERETALKNLNLTLRTGLDDIRGLVSLLVQTLRFGTGIADTLRVYAEEFRDKRMQRAEEQAAKIGTKLIFPLVFCLFPSFFVVAIGPAVIRIVDVFAQLATNVAK
jgi:tight adherence protein C